MHCATYVLSLLQHACGDLQFLGSVRCMLAEPFVVAHRMSFNHGTAKELPSLVGMGEAYVVGRTLITAHPLLVDGQAAHVFLVDVFHGGGSKAAPPPGVTPFETA
jgi:hypothetical protein